MAYKNDLPDAVAVKPTPAAAGTQGWFDEGGNTDHDWANMVQGEIVSVAELGGQTADKTDHTQMATVLAPVQALASDAADTGNTTTYHKRVLVASESSQATGTDSAVVAGKTILNEGDQSAAIASTGAGTLTGVQADGSNAAVMATNGADIDEGSEVAIIAATGGSVERSAESSAILASKDMGANAVKADASVASAIVGSINTAADAEVTGTACALVASDGGTASGTASAVIASKAGSGAPTASGTASAVIASVGAAVASAEGSVTMASQAYTNANAYSVAAGQSGTKKWELDTGTGTIYAETKLEAGASIEVNGLLITVSGSVVTFTLGGYSVDLTIDAGSDGNSITTA